MPAQLTPGEEWHWITTPDGLSLWVGWGAEKNKTLMIAWLIAFILFMDSCQGKISIK